MIRLPDGIAAWWAGRTLRERRLLLVMVALLAVTTAWLATGPRCRSRGT